MRIRSIKKVTLDEPIPVYDITVLETENFCLAAGPVVHNSKDIADAVCGVTSYLMTRRQAWTQQPAFIGQGGYLLHGNRTYHEGLNLLQKSDESEIESQKSVRKTVKRRPVSRRKSA
jgi:hypothetical protein